MILALGLSLLLVYWRLGRWQRQDRRMRAEALEEIRRLRVAAENLGPRERAALRVVRETDSA